MIRSTPVDARALLSAATPVGTLPDGRAVLSVSVPAGAALEAWRALRDVHAETGLWPFLTDPKRGELYPTVWAHLAEAGAAEGGAGAGGVGAVEDLLARWKAEYADDEYEDDEDAEERAAAHRCGPLDLPAEPAAGECWAAGTTEIGLCPAGAGGIEIVRLFAWSGAANYGISGAEHEAVLERWRRQFGAELLTLGFDVIELEVANPPTDPADVARVAEEQFAYCPDNVDQELETVTALAEQWVYSHRWYFWWD